MCVLVYNYNGESLFWKGNGRFTRDIWKAKHYNSESVDYWCNRITSYDLMIGVIDDYL